VLVAAACSGDRAALEELLLRHYDLIHAVCRRLTGNAADAEDAAQEALIAIVRGLPRFRGTSSFRTWAYRIATNTSLDELRRRRRRPVPGPLGHAGEEGPGAASSPQPAPDAFSGSGAFSPAAPDTAHLVAERVDVEAALARVAPLFRAAVVLRDMCGLSYEEISETLGVPIGTVRSRIARGRAALADELGGSPPSWARSKALGKGSEGSALAGTAALGLAAPPAAEGLSTPGEGTPAPVPSVQEPEP